MPRFLSRVFPFLCCSIFLLSTHIAPRADETPTKPILTADAVQEAFVRVAGKLKPSVVTIYAERRPRPSTPKAPGAKPDEKNKDEEEGEDDDDDLPFPFGPRDPDARRTSLGTGMVISDAGDILTNYHVIKDADIIRVLFNADAERPPRPLARVIAFDEESDLAVLRLATREGVPLLAPVEFADSDTVRIGQWAMAIGAPFDQAQTVTVGIVSAKARHLDKDGKLSLQDYIQTDASINPGNSGGPLIDLEGRVIGINTAILSPSRFNVGIGFAVPSNTIRQYLPLLQIGKSVARGFLGIQYTALDAEVAREFGVAGGMQIGALAKRGDEFIGPAKEAGLLEGDIITHVNDKSVISSDDFRRVVAGNPPGTNLKFSVVRPIAAGNETRDFQVTLGDWSTQSGVKPVTPALPLPAVPVSRLGIEVEDAEKLSSDQRELFEVANGEKGPIIVAVNFGSPADDAELRRGLRVVRLRVNGGNWQVPANKKEFLALEKAIPAQARVLIQLRDRQNISVYKLVTTAEKPA